MELSLSSQESAGLHPVEERIYFQMISMSIGIAKAEFDVMMRELEE